MADLPMVYDNPQFLSNHLPGALSSSLEDDLTVDQIEDKPKENDDTPSFVLRAKRISRAKNTTTRGDVYAEAEAEMAKFRKALEEFQKSVGNKTQTINDTGNVHTWEEVQNSLKNAAGEYGGHSGRTAVIRKFFAKLGDSGAVFNTWLQFLPGNDYSSLLCGGFEVIMKAAIEAQGIREDIFDGLGSMPAMLEKAKLYSEMWTSVKLHEGILKLHVAILVVLRHILHWLRDDSFKRATRALFKQESYKDELKSKLSVVEECAASVREEASICSQYAIGSINQTIWGPTHQFNDPEAWMSAIKAELGFENYGSYLAATDEDLYRLFRDLTGALTSWSYEYDSHLGFAHHLGQTPPWNSLCSIYTLNKAGDSPLALKLRHRSTSSAELVELLRKPTADTYAQILLWPHVPDMNHVSWFGLVLKLDPHFFQALIAAVRRAEHKSVHEDSHGLLYEPNHGVLGKVGATITRLCISPGQESVPVVIIAGAFDPSFGEGTLQGLQEDLDRVAIEWSNLYEKTLSRILRERDRATTGTAAVLLTTLLPLVHLQARNIRAMPNSLRGAFLKVTLLDPNDDSYSKESSTLREGRLRLRRVIEKYEDDWDLFIQYLRLQEETDWLQGSGFLAAAEAYARALKDARRLELEVRDFMQLQAGELALQESRKSIELSNLQIQEGKRVKIFTILAFVYVPLNLATSIFGMNIQQLNSSGKDLWIFFATAVIALLITGSLWLFMENINTYMLWYRRNEEIRTKPNGKKPKYSMAVRAAMLSWLLRQGHGRWAWASGAFLCILTNDRYGKFHEQTSTETGASMSAGDYVWKYSQDSGPQHHFSYPKLLGSMAAREALDNAV